MKDVGGCVTLLLGRQLFRFQNLADDGQKQFETGLPLRLALR